MVDLDGTLLGSKRKPAERDLLALLRLQDMGYAVAVATGRSNYSFLKLLDTLTRSLATIVLPVNYVIFSTGAGIMDFPDKKLLNSFSLSPQEISLTVECLEKLDLDYMIHKPVPDTRYFLYRSNGGENPDFQRRLKIYDSFATPYTPALLAGYEGATEVLCIVPADQGHRLAAEIIACLQQCSVIKATSPLDGKSIWIEIFAPCVSKSRAVQWLAEEIGIEQVNICAVGNDYNDEDLLRWAGSSFVVGNAPEPLKEEFLTVESNDNSGVSQAVELWLATRSQMPE